MVSRYTRPMTTTIAVWFLSPGTAGFQPAFAALDPGRLAAVVEFRHNFNTVT
jgi:hypothetical protein